jgi:hypothetical protein
MSSWLWGNETTEQAQIVVSALQSELDEREGKIQALEAALRREQQEFARVVGDEIAALEQRKARIEAELSEVDALIKEKQRALKSGSKKEKKTKKKKKDEAVTPKAAAEATPKAATTTPKAAPKELPKKLPMDEHLTKIAKVEPNVAFIIQRSTVRMAGSCRVWNRMR